MEIPIVLIVFGSMILSLKLVLDYRRERWSLRGQEPSRGDSSLGMSELKRLVREAVEEAVDPLVARIDAMEPSVRKLAASSRTKALPEATAEAGTDAEFEIAESDRSVS